MEQERDLSIVIPVFNECDSISPLLEQVFASPAAERLLEVLFVDDGSRDGTQEVIERAAGEDQRVRAIFFRRNFGKSAALDAGFRAATGRFIVTMDGDLQDDPAEIPNLLAKIEEGADVVSGWKEQRNDPLDKTLPSRVFNAVVRAASGVRLHDFNCGLKAYRAEVVRELNIYGELHRFIPVLAHSRGFRVGEISVRHRPRVHGRSKFGAWRLISGFLDFTTVMFLSRYTRRPLHLFGLFGFAMFALGLLINVYLTFVWLGGEALKNRPLLLLGVLAMILGFQLVSLGLIGEMMVSVRPGHDHYSIARAVNLPDED